jgi:hypothetical protein
MNVTADRAVFTQYTQEIPGSNPCAKTRYSAWGAGRVGAWVSSAPPPGQILGSRLTVGHDQFVPCHIM